MTWVCDSCMQTVTRDQIGDIADGEHVLCTNCIIDSRVTAWHQGAGEGLELHKFLGMTFDQYRAWTQNPISPLISNQLDSDPPTD